MPSGVGKYEAFKPNAQKIQEKAIKKEKWVIDPIFVTGRVKPEKLLGLAPFTEECDWAAQLKDCLDPARKDVEKWCGYNGKPFKTVAPNWPTASKIDVQELEDFSKSSTPVFSEMSNSYEAQLLVKYFKVKKKNLDINDEGVQEVLARIITSCRTMNTLFGKSPTLRLPSISTIFETMAMFPSPCFAVCDFRHWFYQIPLPRSVRRLFVVKGPKGRNFQLNALPMGFRWSPWIAQGVSMSMIYEARKRWCNKLGPGGDERNTIPKEAYGEFVDFIGMEGTPVARVIAWYDNILVVAKDKQTRDAIQGELDSVFRECGAVVKFSDLDKNLEELGKSKASVQKMNHAKPGKRLSGWTESTHKVEYVGLIFKRTAEGVQWKHVPSNVEDWVHLRDLQATTTARKVAEAMGVLLWDCRVAGHPLSELAILLQDYSEIGKRMHECGGSRHDWDKEISISPECHKRLSKEVSKMLGKAETWRIREEKELVKRNRASFLAGDSSGWRGAGMRLTDLERTFHEMLFLENWDEFDPTLAKESINCKEIVTAIETIMAECDFLEGLGIDPKEVNFVFAEDNTTAVHALNNLYFGKNPRVCGKLFELYGRVGLDGVSAHYINTKEMPADEPSRNMSVNVVKCKKCLEKLMGLEECKRIPTSKRERQTSM